MDVVAEPSSDELVMDLMVHMRPCAPPLRSVATMPGKVFHTVRSGTLPLTPLIKKLEEVARDHGFAVATKTITQLDKMSFQEALEWLQAAPLAVGLHYHQGTTWDAQQTLRAWACSQYVPMFPRGAMHCPVVTQDKRAYLRVMAAHGIATIPTTFFGTRDAVEGTPLVPPASASDTFVVKVPRESGGVGVVLNVARKDLEDVVRDQLEFQDYVLIQPLLRRSEVKYVFIEGALYGSIRVHGGFDESLGEEMAKEILSIAQRDGRFVTDPLFRVDLMRLADGTLVLNELENLEAMTQTMAGGTQPAIRSILDTWPRKWWAKNMG